MENEKNMENSRTQEQQGGASINLNGWPAVAAIVGITATVMICVCIHTRT